MREVSIMQAEAATIEPTDASELIRRAAALIFDVDGTLAETEELHRQASTTPLSATVSTGIGTAPSTRTCCG